MVTIHITIFQWGLKVVSDKLIGTILHKILLIRKVYRYKRFSNVFHDLQTYFQQPVSEKKKWRNTAADLGSSALILICFDTTFENVKRGDLQVCKTVLVICNNVTRPPLKAIATG